MIGAGSSVGAISYSLFCSAGQTRAGISVIRLLLFHKSEEEVVQRRPLASIERAIDRTTLSLTL
jgi:hypothetical protein